MTDVQLVLLKLLREIDQICEKEQIGYFLADHTAFYAYMKNGFTGKVYEANVLMTQEDALRFSKAVQKERRKDRALESLQTNKKMPGCYFRYTDENTLLMDLDTTYGYYQSYGIGVNIRILQPMPKSILRKKWQAALSVGWRTMHGGRKTRLMHKALGMGVGLMMGIFGEKRVAGWLWNLAMKPAKKIDPRRYRICDAIQGLGKWVPVEIFQEAAHEQLEGNYFRICSDPQEYLQRIYGKSWKTPRMGIPKESYKVYADSQLPYAYFLQAAKERHMLTKEFIRERKKFFLLDSRKGAPRKRDVVWTWNVLFRTADRFEMWCEYMPQKQELLELYEEGQYAQLHVKLMPYLNMLKQNYKRKLGLCFDKDIFDITMELLRYEGEEEYAQKLISLVPPSDYEEIHIA